MKKRLFIFFQAFDDPALGNIAHHFNEDYQIYDARNLFNGEFRVSEALLQAELFKRNCILFNATNLDCLNEETVRRGFHILKRTLHYIYPQAEIEVPCCDPLYNSMLVDYESQFEAEDSLADLKLDILPD